MITLQVSDEFIRGGEIHWFVNESSDPLPPLLPLSVESNVFSLTQGKEDVIVEEVYR